MENDLGYKKLDGVTPTQCKLDAAKADISAVKLSNFRQSFSSLVGYESVGWGRNCEDVFLEGLNLEEDEHLRQRLLQPYKRARAARKHAIVFIQNMKDLRRVRVGRGYVFVFKALDEELGPENGFFKIVPGLHKDPTSQEEAERLKNMEAIEITLKPGQAIIVDGESLIEYPRTGGGFALMLCISKT